MSAKIKVAIGGISGRMGRASSMLILEGSEQFELVGAFGRENADYAGLDVGEFVGCKSNGVKISNGLSSMLSQCKPDIVFENSVAEYSVEIAKTLIPAGIRPVMGTSGIPDADVKALDELSRKHRTGALLIPNFSIGAVLMMEFARQAGAFFENVEVVEMHHTKKLDAPSGTAMHTVKKLASMREQYNAKEVEEHELLKGSRGAVGQSGVRVHSLRLPGLISHQEVIFGGPGELFTIRHDSFNMDCFLKGIGLSLSFVMGIDHLVLGLDNVLGLGAQERATAAVK